MSKIKGVMLRETCPELVSKLREYFKKEDKTDLVDQVDQLFVELQILNGTPGDFSFMAYPIPRLTVDQRRLMEMQPEEKVDIQMNDSNIRVVLDEFGQINWFYVIHAPEIFNALSKSLKN